MVRSEDDVECRKSEVVARIASDIQTDPVMTGRDDEEIYLEIA
jgi:hypothetical protein